MNSGAVFDREELEKKSRIDISSMVCKCEIFREDLLKFFMNSDLSDQYLLMKNLENFFKRYSGHEVNGVAAKECSQELCSSLLSIKNKNRLNGMKFLTKIIDIICLMTSYNDNCVLSLMYSRNLFSVFRHSCDLMDILRFCTALHGKSDFMKLLVNLDLLSSIENDSMSWSRMKVGIFSILSEFMHNVIIMDSREDDVIDVDHVPRIFEYFRDGEENSVTNDFENSTLKDFLNVTGYLFNRENNCKSSKRIYLTMIAILAAHYKLCKKESKANHFIYCIRSYFSVSRDPLITINEVRILLYTCLHFLNKLESFDLHSAEFNKIMPECSAKLKPRSLTHLTRCKIRETIKKGDLNLPAALSKLDLPKPLKEFVLGDVIQMSRKNDTVSSEHIISNWELEQIISETMGSISLPDLLI